MMHCTCTLEIQIQSSHATCHAKKCKQPKATNLAVGDTGCRYTGKNLVFSRYQKSAQFKDVSSGAGSRMSTHHLKDIASCLQPPLKILLILGDEAIIANQPHDSN